MGEPVVAAAEVDRPQKQQTQQHAEQQQVEDGAEQDVSGSVTPSQDSASNSSSAAPGSDSQTQHQQQEQGQQCLKGGREMKTPQKTAAGARDKVPAADNSDSDSDNDAPADIGLGVDVKGAMSEDLGILGYWEEVCSNQGRDPELAGWRKQLAQGQTVKREGGTVVSDPKDGVLLFVDKEGRKRVVVPPGDREAVKEFAHESPADGGHFGVRKGMAKLSARYWWPGMSSEFKAWVAGCRQCQIYKHYRGRAVVPKDTPRIIPRRPWESVYVDAVGPLGTGGRRV